MKSKGEADILKGSKIVLYFLTENEGKYAEAARIAAKYGTNLKQLKRSKVEIQSDKLQSIAMFAASQACKVTRDSIIADDSGFFIRALRGFPGPFSSYVYKTIGNNGILRLLQTVKVRDAYFQASVAFCKPETRPVCFTGTVHGVVSRHQRGGDGFGFDPIFIPEEGDGRTFAQMSISEKNLISHRAKAFTGFFEWFSRNSKPCANS